LRPEVGSITAPRHLSSVLLPEPDGPIRPTTSPGATCRLTSFNARTAVSPVPKRLARRSMRMPFAPIFLPDRFGRIDPQRHADRDDAGQHADRQHGEQAED